MRHQLASMVAAATLACAIGAAEEQAFEHPVLRVPKLERPPALDGRIQAGEWEKAAAITGFAAVAGVGPNTLVPEIQQVVWYLGYDDRYLYLAMHSPHQKGTYPVARVKDDEDQGILFEDHVEIQISPYARDRASRPGYGFYKIMVNPKEAMTDWHYFNGTVGTEQLWTMGGERKCHVAEDHWDLELSVELARLQKKTLDGQSLVIQLVRTDSCAGVYFAGWVPAAWMSWNAFAEVSFDPAAPVFQFRRLGEVMEGNLDALVALTGSRPEPVEATVSVTVADGDGTVLHQGEQSVTVSRGETALVNLKQDAIPVPSGREKRNTFEIRAAYREGGRTVLLYHNKSPFMRLDDAFREQFLNPWLAGRPQSGEWEYRIAYLPSANRAQVGVDLDFFGMPAAIQSARAFTVEIRPQDRRQALARVAAPIADLKGRAVLELPELRAGKYEAAFQLLESEDGRVLAEKTADFERRYFEWENNSLGRDPEVIPPFTRMAVERPPAGLPAIRTWGAVYTLQAGGLLNQISARMPTGNSGQPVPLLAAPMRLEAHAGGTLLDVVPEEARVTDARPDRVTVESRQRIGPLTIAVQALEEYDNWYQVGLQVAAAEGASLDALDLVVDLRDAPADTLYVQRRGDGRYGNRFGGIPAAPGVHFRSTDLLAFRAHRDWKSFVPRVYVGNGDCGLWFFAWCAEDWELRDEQPMLQVERLDDRQVRMRIRLLAGPVTLDRPRRLEFAFQSAPVKPNDPRYRTRSDEGAISHDTSGYRYYGDSVDSFSLPRASDYEALRKFLLYGPVDQNEESRQRWWAYSRHAPVHWGGRLVLYGSTWMTGLGAEEFRTFGGEWLGKSNWEAQPDSHFKDNWNYQGTIQWNTPERLSPCGVNWTRSFTDFFVYHHDRLIDLSGVNGTWWDNSSIGVIRDYDPARGEVLPVFNTLHRRELCKRLNVVGWKHMRQPMWVMNMHTDFSWNQIFWMVENDWYCTAPDMTALDQWTLDEFRAMCRTKSTMLLAKPWFNGFKGQTEELDRKVQRSLDGLCLLHDIPRFDAALKRKLVYVLDYADTQNCLFTGYWRTRDVAQPGGEGLLVSTYANARRKAAVLVFYNTQRGRDQYLAGTTFDAGKVMGLGGQPQNLTISDFESDKPVNVAFESDAFKITAPYPVPWHEYRILAIEGD